MPQLPEPIRSLADRVGHVRLSVLDLDAVHDLEDTGDIVFAAGPRVIDLDEIELSLERLHARGLTITDARRPA